MIQSKDNQYLKNLKEKIQAKLVEKKLKREQTFFSKSPRYDEIFFNGVKWLEGLASDPVQDLKTL
ncbi:MAG: hypothetical protein HY787_29635 [Deltaproteobacteria bacterium]|nr:hypothetical protein [Deltaproteobacteria bacterium]